MKRREVIRSLLGTVIISPLSARGQTQEPVSRLIGFLSSRSARESGDVVEGNQFSELDERFCYFCLDCSTAHKGSHDVCLQCCLGVRGTCRLARHFVLCRPHVRRKEVSHRNGCSDRCVGNPARRLGSGAPVVRVGSTEAADRETRRRSVRGIFSACACSAKEKSVMSSSPLRNKCVRGDSDSVSQNSRIVT